MKIKKSYQNLVLLACCILLITAGVLAYTSQTDTGMTYNAFLNAVSSGQVSEVTVQGSTGALGVTLTTGETFQMLNPESQEFLNYLVEYDVPVFYQDTGSGSPIAQFLVCLAAAGGILYYRFRKPADPLIQDAASDRSSTSSLTLADVAGNAEAKAMVQDIIRFIQNPEKYTEIGAKMPHGILFYGPPGTGKTLMAKAIAGEAGVPFYPMSGSDFIQMYVGVGASRIRSLFKIAKKAEKAVIFIDEIDAIGKRRGRQTDSGNDERDQTLNALLTEMSGFNERDGIVVIAATNRLDILDEALTRPGRFDRLVEIGLPDVNARLSILSLYAHSRRLDAGVDLHELARSTVSFSGSMLENLLNEAAILAANNGLASIGQTQIDKAFHMVIAGAEKSDTSYITQKDRNITAYHEAGHALATHLLLPDSYISRVTIIPCVQGAGGYSLSIPRDSLYMAKQQMLAHLQVLLAGRASEELVFGPGEITTGASNDIEKASALMVDYINKYGMDDEFGLFNCNVLDAAGSASLPDLCRKRLKEEYANTKMLLEENQNTLCQIACALLEKETLRGEDIQDLCA